jgi:cytochrome P450
MKRLELTRDVFREAMRLYPPVAVLARDATCPETLLTKQVDPGSTIFISPWVMHRHEQFWDKPDVFDPDRFETPNGQEGLRCAYLPFSMGPRVCAGAAFALQEAALLIAELARRYRFLPVPGHVPEPVARLTLRSANGVPLIVERR